MTTPPDSKLQTHLNSCVRCGLCADSCMYYKAYKEAKYIPAAKVKIVTAAYRRFPKKKISEKMLREMVDLLFGSCTMCGRCVKHCSIGVDIPYLVRKGREIVAAMDKVPSSLQATVDAALRSGNNMAIPADEFRDTIQWMEEELQDEVNDPAACIPLDQPQKNIHYTLNPREPKFFPLSITAMAKIFYAARERWTLSSKFYDVTNYGLFSGDNSAARQIAGNLYDETHRLQADRLVLGECGHGTRASRWEGPNWLQTACDFEVLSAVELMGEYIRQGRIRLDKTLNQKIYTLHDPCNLVRNGGLCNELRFVVQNAVVHLVEMTPHGVDNFCCGGGGGNLAMSEYNERRLKTGAIKAEQIRQTGAKVVITPCHNCVDQLIQLNHTYKLGVEIKTVAEIVADALILT
ncbi:MAG: (Fe-S)-binding protein [Bacteroidetes bacterium]|nr:(Fe-S)-binding protein [Bacteroidota bacterium]